MAEAFEDYGFEVRVASREAVPALIALWGGSGSGKTFSALELALGLVGPNGKICVLDTENGRAKFYSDILLPTKWMHLDMQPPFTPTKYSAAFKFLREQGANVVIVDSQSHVWEGEGGVLEMAEKSSSKGLLKWKNPKLAHKRMVNDLMRSPVHVIFAVREKEVMRQQGDTYVSDRFAPISEKNFIFEMTIALRMTKDGYYDKATQPYYYKVPAGLQDAIPVGGRVTREMGKSIADWLAGGVAVDSELQPLVDRAQSEADKGMKKYSEFWGSITPAQKKKLQSRHDGYKAHAAEVDIDNAREAEYASAGSIFTPTPATE